MDLLKLAALDADDLKVIAAHVQDAVGQVGDIHWRPQEKRLTLELNRFVWEKTGKRGLYERRRSLLHFARVNAVQAAHIRRDVPDAVVSLLTIRVEVKDEPAAWVFLEFAGGGSLRLDVECIEASLTDLGPAWSTENIPTHSEA
ncbi:DUF2948 family protein [Oryzibacter oryziterrae]|uniref:DUF2948 family protein n=1 Tax=Oryzibacter oryziterrae TaxID=2766474 RepID=UPI001F45C7ED|nr:DUF2948 family protein [Oryzibacter oryziterrae]